MSSVSAVTENRSHDGAPTPESRTDRPAGESRRRLILGAEARGTAADAHPWGALPADLDVASYDEVIVNLGPGGTAAEPMALDGDPLTLIDQLARLLLSEGGQLTVVGNPDTPIETPDGSVPFSFLLPVRLEVEEAAGEGLRVLEQRLEPYFADVGTWSFTFTGRCQVAEDALEASGVPAAPGRDLSVELSPLAESGEGRAVAISARFEVPALGASTERRGSRLTVLPAPTETDVARAIDRLLALEPGEGPAFRLEPDVCDAPGWADDIRLPAEEAVREEMRSVEREKERLEERLAEHRRRLRDEGRLKRLLYAEGDALLEAVGEAFDRLGGRTEAGENAVRIVDPEGRRAIVGVRSTPGTIDVAAVRDVDRVVRDAIALEGWEGRGVLVANARADVAPAARGLAFTDDALEIARRFDVALLRTEQLFAAVRDAQRGTFDRDRFWERVMDADGPVDLPGLQ